MTFRRESERMFVSVLLAAAFHVVALIVVQRLLDVDRDLHSSSERLTVQLIATDVPSPVSDEESLEPAVLSASMQENVMPSVLTPEPVAAVSHSPEEEIVSLSEPEFVQEPTLVKPESKSEKDSVDASATSLVPPWVPTLQRPVEAVPVRGRGGLAALSLIGGTSAGGRSGAAVTAPALWAGKVVGVRPSGEYEGLADLVPAYNDGLKLPVDESVYASSSVGPDTVAPSLRGVSPDNSMANNAGFLGQQRVAAPLLMPVRRSGSPTIKRGDAAGKGSRVSESSAAPVIATEIGLPSIGSRQATVEVAMLMQTGDASPIIGVDRLARLDQVLRDGGSSSDRTMSSDGKLISAQQNASGQPLLALGGSGLRLPEGIEVSASLGMRRLVAVTTPVLPDGIPSEIVRSTVRVHIIVDPQGWVKPLGFSPDSGSTALNNEIYAALRKWRYESVRDQQPVNGTITIEIRTRST